MTSIAPRKTHHHGNLKEALLGYAAQAARLGTLDDLSLRKASRDLGVSPGAAYRHFADRDALMSAVAQRGFDALADTFETVLPFASAPRDAADAKRRFHGLAAAYVDFARQNYGLWRLMFGPHGKAAGPEDRTRASTYDWLAKSLSELAQFGTIAPPGAAGQFFAWSSIHGLSDLQASPAVSAAELQDVVRSQCRFICAALAAPSP
jgi:AcrR family transcriptional regulator